MVCVLSSGLCADQAPLFWSLLIVLGSGHCAWQWSLCWAVVIMLGQVKLLLPVATNKYWYQYINSLSVRHFGKHWSSLHFQYWWAIRTTISWHFCRTDDKEYKQKLLRISLCYCYKNRRDNSIFNAYTPQPFELDFNKKKYWEVLQTSVEFIALKCWPLNTRQMFLDILQRFIDILVWCCSNERLRFTPEFHQNSETATKQLLLVTFRAVLWHALRSHGIIPRTTIPECFFFLFSYILDWRYLQGRNCALVPSIRKKNRWQLVGE